MNQDTNRHRRPFGRGTIAMIVGIVAFGVYSYATQPPHIRSQRFEPDAAGRLRPVEHPISHQAPKTPIWKPEPHLLLRHAQRLAISPAQLMRIDEIARAWTASKTELEAQIRAITAPLRNARTLRMSGEGSYDLSKYSTLSREFERARSGAWEKALAALSESQRTELFRIVEEEAK